MASTRNEFYRLAKALGYQLSPGTKHWRARHPVSGGCAIVPYGRKFSPRDERNIRANLRRNARSTYLLHP